MSPSQECSTGINNIFLKIVAKSLQRFRRPYDHIQFTCICTYTYIQTYINVYIIFCIFEMCMATYGMYVVYAYGI